MGDRHQFRAKWHDYNGGIYFVTICSCEKKHSFGRILNNTFQPSELGEIIIDHLRNLPTHYSDVELWNSVIMPNHIHLVIAVGTRFFASTEKPETRFFASTENCELNLGCLKHSKSGEECEYFHHNSRLASIIGTFKAGVTRTARTRRIASLPVWQSRFYEHIIKSQYSFENIMNYIDTNVENWHSDCFANS